MPDPCVAYYRVSTQRQGTSGLGLEAQQNAVREYAQANNICIITEFTEIESGRKTSRVELENAFKEAKKQKALLVIAKIDRLSRNVAFISRLMESKVEFVAVDMPDATSFTIHIMAAVAEHEARMISDRTKAALKAAKDRGTRLGNPHLRSDNQERIKQADDFAAKLSNTISIYKSTGMSTPKIVSELNRLGVDAPRGGKWTVTQLQRVIRRIESLG